MCGGSGGSGGRSGGGGGSTNGDAGQPGEVVRAANIANPGAQMLDNLRSGKLSLADAEAAADGLLTASMKSRNFEETRAINKKYAAAMDAIDAYKRERGTFKPVVEKTSGQVAYERYQARRKYEGSR